MKSLLVVDGFVFEKEVVLNLKRTNVPREFVLCRTGTHMAVFACGEANRVIIFPHVKDDVVRFTKEGSNEVCDYVVKQAVLKHEGDEYFVETTFVLQGD